MKTSFLCFLLLFFFGALVHTQASVTAVDFGANYSGSNINSAGWGSGQTPPVAYTTHDANFNGLTTDRTQYVSLGQEHTAPNAGAWTTPVGKSGAVIRYGTSIANIGSSDDPTMSLVRYNAGADLLQTTSGAGTSAMRMASAWYWEKSSFLNGADSFDSLAFANQAGSLTASFSNSGTPSTGNTRLARFMIQSGGSWFLSGDAFSGTSGTLSINAADATWHNFDPHSASLLFYNPSGMGSGVLGSTLTDISAIGVHVQHELFDGTINNAMSHQFGSLEAAVIPEPATVSVLLGLGALAFVLIRRRIVGRSGKAVSGE